MEKRYHVLIDTDIGGDVDDALALALALNTPSVEIVGITNVYIANAWRAGVTHDLLRVFGRDDIPVCAGAEKPLIGWWDENHSVPDAPDYGTFRGEKLPHAADFIIRMAERYADLIILAIGPLTNIGTALLKAPHIAKSIRVYMMGGQVKKAYPEWNVKCDPEAARILFESGTDITMVGRDVTLRCQFTRAEVDEIKAAGNPRTEKLGAMMETFIRDFGYLPILHDPLTLAALLWPDLLKLEPLHILIETRGEYTRGVTVDCDWGAGSKAMVATDVDAAGFKRRLIEVLKL